MTREEFMKHAKSEIEEVFGNKRNRLMNLIQQAYAEGRRNAEADLTDKHSFKNVMKCWLRYKIENGCGDELLNYTSVKRWEEHYIIEHIEKEVLEWAEKNPEPKEEKLKKTKWIDWLESQGLVVKFWDNNNPRGYSEEFTDKLFEEVPEKFLEN